MSFNQTPDTAGNNVVIPVGIIIIGRNEESNLTRVFDSIQNNTNCICLYVDSGSTDRSVDIAREKGIDVHILSSDKPFSPARARSEGADLLISNHPNLDFLQFIDGDCELTPDWLGIAVKHFHNNNDVGVVCGKLKELAPEKSVYNWLSSKQWEAYQTGKIQNCGGIFIIRKEVYIEAGGFDPTLITMEEQEFCSRILKIGSLIERLGEEMAVHDSGLHSFRQWWNRAVWGGYGAGLRFTKVNDKNKLIYLRKYFSIPFLLVLSILFFISGVLISKWFHIFPGLYLLVLAFLLLRVFIYCKKNNYSNKDSIIYSVFTVLRKFPVGIGFLKYFFKIKKNRNPDPHNSNN